MSRRGLQQSALPWYLLAALGSPQTAVAQNNPVTVAILPFQDRGSYARTRKHSVHSSWGSRQRSRASCEDTRSSGWQMPTGFTARFPGRR
jgi:hypothetical protein